MAKLLRPAIEFKYGLNELEEVEMRAKGYRSNVIVTLPDNVKYELCFYDPIRLNQDVEDEEVIYEAGLVIIKEVTKENIEKAITRMWQTGFFKKLVPIP